MNDIELIKKYMPVNKHKKALKKLKKGYPVQYIIGNTQFIDNIIFVNKKVLIPRFETEILVDEIIKFIKNNNIVNPNILELGTGSGCISIAINSKIKSSIDALDISNGSIKIAKKNAKFNNVNINFIRKDMFKYNSNKKYDIIVSNPPYVSFDEEAHNIKYEPKKAIYASEDGLYFYKRILKKYKNNLNNKFLIAFEIGAYQKDSIINFIKEEFDNVKIHTFKDYSNRDRIIFITNYE